MLHVQNFPEGSFPRVHLRQTGVHAIYRTKHNTRRAFCGHFVYWWVFFRLWYGPIRTHTLYMLIHNYMWIFTWIIASIPCDISHDIGIAISQKYSRHWYRCISIISHDTYAESFYIRYRTHKFLNHRCLLSASVSYITAVSSSYLSGNQAKYLISRLFVILGQY